VATIDRDVRLFNGRCSVRRCRYSSSADAAIIRTSRRQSGRSILEQPSDSGFISTSSTSADEWIYAALIDIEHDGGGSMTSRTTIGCLFSASDILRMRRFIKRHRITVYLPVTLCRSRNPDRPPAVLRRLTAQIVVTRCSSE